jgi:N6-L-threonylcarbamoyladenine synthase
MIVLGLESSCDETAAALVEDGSVVLADVISSQAAVHARYGGVVPELASRHHLTNLMPVLEQVLAEARVGLDDVGAVAVTCGPGLPGALLVALQAAKSIAFARGVPLVGVNHLAGHLAAVYLRGRGEPPVRIPSTPYLGLLVSGGHTCLIRVDHGETFRVLGKTIDDAAGEAFDKVAKLLGLGYPGGALVDRLARVGDPARWQFPRAMAARGVRDFSFSGLKTAVLYHTQRHGLPPVDGVHDGQRGPSTELADLCASVQQAIVDVLVDKTVAVAQEEGLGQVVLCGGVAANGQLRQQLHAACGARGIELFVPPPPRCTDNAAMIAAAGARRLALGLRSPLSLAATPNLPLEEARSPLPGASP